MQHFIKKAAALAMAMVMALSLASVAFAADFDDMPDDWSTTALEAAVEHGLLSGKDGKIAASDALTRAELATIITRAFGAEVEDDVAQYADINMETWYRAAAGKALHMGAMNGKGDKFAGADNITRQEVMVVLARVLKLADGGAADLADFADADKVAAWAVPSVAAMVKAGYVTVLKPVDNITRAEFAQMMYNIFNNAYISEAGTVEEVNGKNVIISSTNVTVKGVDIEGDVIVADGVGDGDVFFEDVTIGGRVVVRGGGMNSIHFKDSKAVDVIINKVDGNVRVVFEGESEVATVSVEAGKASTDVRVEGTVGKVVVNDATSTVVLADATVEAVEVNASNATVSLAGKTTVTEMTVAEGATKTTVNAEPTTEITKLETSEDVFINNEDAIKDCNDETKINPEGEEPTESAAPTESTAADPEDKVAHVHTFKTKTTEDGKTVEDWTAYDADQHYTTCVKKVTEGQTEKDVGCGATIYRPHNFVKGKAGTDDANKTLCKDCGFVSKVADEVATPSGQPDCKNHVWADEPAASPAATEATCTTDGTATYKCTKMVTVTVPAREGDAEPTTTEVPCEAVKTVTTPATGHTYDKSKGVRVEPKCYEKGSITYTCTVCKSNETADKMVEVIPATGNHVAKAEWTSNDDQHWHVCATEGCTAVVGSKANHGWTTKVVYTGEGDEKTSTQHQEVCTACGKTKDAAAHGDFTYSAGAENHVKTCGGCGYKVTEKHTYDQNTNTTCVCGKVDPKHTEHTYNETTDKCACGAVKPGHEHSWKKASSQEGVTAATCTVAGKEKQECACGATQTIDVRATGHDWENGTCKNSNKCVCPDKDNHPVATEIDKGKSETCNTCKLKVDGTKETTVQGTT